MDCIFCKIINGSIPSKCIYEDDIVYVILDIKPRSNGHMLILSKKHFSNLMDIDIDTLTYINKVAKNMYSLLKDRLSIDGLSISQNNEYGQDISHYHMHLVPTYRNNISMTLDEVYDKLML